MAGPGTGRSLRLGFAGTPEFAATVLHGLIEAGQAPVVVYTQPDRPTGRGRRLQEPPVKTLALEHAITVRQPESLRGSAPADELAESRLDALVVAAYGLILPGTILSVPRLGCINVHASLLPRWRGAAPVERAIMAGDRETGVSIMQMDRGLDTGPVYAQRRCPITADTDGPGLEQHLAHLGCQALLACLSQLPGLVPTPQPDTGVTYAHKLSREDAVIRWPRSSLAIERQVRALRGRLPAYTEGGGVRITILEATVADTAHPTSAGMPGTIVSAGRTGIQVACGEGVLNITLLKLSVGKGRPLSAADAVNGFPGLFAAGARLAEREPEVEPPGTPGRGPDS